MYKLLDLVILVLIITRASFASNNAINRVDCGIIKVGQTKQIILPIINDMQSAMIIDEIRVCCGNLPPTINNRKLPPGGKALLVQQIKKNKPCTFVVSTYVHISQPVSHTLEFKITGEAIQPITASIGWLGSSLKLVDYNEDYISLKDISREGKKLILQLSPCDEQSIKTISSQYFKVEKRTQKRDAVIVNLITSPQLPIGDLKDIITCQFQDGAECRIPLYFRVLSDVYGEESLLSLGNIPPSGKIQKKYKILFQKPLRPWSKLNWKAEGEISKAINIRPSNQASSDCLVLSVELDSSKLASSMKGFIHCYIMFYGNDLSDRSTVRLLLYGYK